MKHNTFKEWAEYKLKIKTKGQELKENELFALYEYCNYELPDAFYGLYKVLKPINIKELMTIHKNRYWINHEKIKQYINDKIIEEINFTRFNFHDLGEVEK